MLFTANKIEKLTKRSEHIFSVFTKTQTELAENNLEIDTVIKEKEAEKAKIEADILALSLITDKNTKLENKIKAFLES